jgi:hypothetical protein
VALRRLEQELSSEDRDKVIRDLLGEMRHG